MTAVDRVLSVEFDERSLIHREPEVARERDLAAFALIEVGRLAPVGREGRGPWRLRLAAADEALSIDLSPEAGGEATRIELELTPFDGAIRDFLLIRESYRKAILRSTPSQIDAIDEGMRAVRDEGAERIRAAAPNLAMDEETSRALFGVLCATHVRL